MPGIQFEGMDDLVKMMAKFGDPEQLFDRSFRDTAIKYERELKSTTNRRTGITANAWGTPRRRGLSNYILSNNVKTADRKHLIVDLLNNGNGVTGSGRVYPKRAKRLFLPLNETGRSKKLGAPIPSGWKWGKEYVLVKSVKAYPGNRFLDKAIKQAGSDLQDAMMAAVTAEVNRHG